MVYRFFTLLIICIIGFVMAAGCITDTEEINTENNGLFDLPLSPPPPDIMVSVSVEKDPIYNTISVRFDGGRGQNVVRSVTARVTFSDGRTDQKELMPRSGNTVTFEGTGGMDIVEVVVSYMSGESYKVLSEEVGFLRAYIQK